MEPLDISSLSDGQKEHLMNEVNQQIMVAAYQDLVHKMIDKCFKKCISKPGTSLDGSEQKCLAMCMDRYLDSHALVSNAYFNRVKRDSQRM